MCEGREVERCEKVLEEECSLVEEVKRQECRLKNRSAAVWRGSSAGRGQLEGKFP